MHIVDSLNLGGAERVAVNVANVLAQRGLSVHLCTTRASGRLEAIVGAGVARLRLQRSSRLDIEAIRRLAQYVREEQIEILHAHGTSIFVAALASMLTRRVKVVWHVHSGAWPTDKTALWPFRLLRARVAFVLTASEPLTHWVKERLGFPATAVTYLHNFVLPRSEGAEGDRLPGASGMRIVYTANFAAAKDHRNLLEAMRIVVERSNGAHLVLLGGGEDGDMARDLRDTVGQLGLANHVSFLGQRMDVPDLLAQADIGVISSYAEGLPLSLLEYGEAGLAVVTTDVGQCADVVERGSAGLVVPRRDPEALAGALLSLLASPERRKQLAERLRERVRSDYSAEGAINSLTRLYDALSR